MAQHDDVDTMTYEQALGRLDTIIAQLEGGDVELEQAVDCYELGVRLEQRCAELLDRTEQRVTQLVLGAGGNPQERPFKAGGGNGEGSGARPGVPTARAVPPAAKEGAAPGQLFAGLGPVPRPRRDHADPPIDPDDVPF